MCAAAVLGLAAPLVQDPIVGMVQPFVQQNISKRDGSGEDWRYREAATLAFGAILDGPSLATLRPLTTDGLRFLLEALKTEHHTMVLDTTLWAIGRILEHAHVPEIITPQLAELVGVLHVALKQSEHLAQKAIFALVALTEGFATDDHARATSPILPSLPQMIGALLETTQREHLGLQVRLVSSLDPIPLTDLYV